MLRFLTFFLVIQSVFAVEEIYPPAPPEQSGRALPEVKVSSLQIPITISLNNFAQEANSLIPKELHSESGIDLGCWVGNCSGSLTITKNGDLTLSAADNTIISYIPLYAKGRVDWYVDLFVGIAEHHEDGHAYINVTANTVIDILSNWSMDANSSLDIHVPEAIIDTPVSSVSIREEVRNAIKPHLKKVANKLDEKIETSLALQEKVQQLWKELKQPIQISQDPFLQLEIKPTRFLFNGFTAGVGNTLNTVISAQANLVVKASQEIKDYQTMALGSLPALEKGTLNQNKIYAYLPIWLDFNEAFNQLESKDLVHAHAINKKLSITFKATKAYGSEDKVILEAEFQLDLENEPYSKGIVYFTAKPKIENNILYFEEFQFDAKTIKSASGVVNQLLDGTLKGYAEKKFQFDLNEKLAKMQNTVKQELQQANIDSNMQLSANIDNINIKDIYIRSTGLIILTELIGDLQLSF